MEKGRQVICIRAFVGITDEGKFISALMPIRGNKYTVTNVIRRGVFDFLDIEGFPTSSHFNADNFRVLETEKEPIKHELNTA